MKSLALLAVFTACVLQAQEGSFIRNFALLRALDTDRDGVISAAEIAAAAESLRALDADQDGKLSAEECADSGGHGPSANEMVKTLMAFDKNGDGKLQRHEVPERMHGLFDRGDLNHDGVLTMDEIRKLAQADQAFQNQEYVGDPEVRHRLALTIMRVIPVLAALDADHDGEISESEIRNAPAVLQTFDKNSDGRLTADEVTPNPLLALVAEHALEVRASFTPDGNQKQPEAVQKK